MYPLLCLEPKLLCKYGALVAQPTAASTLSDLKSSNLHRSTLFLVIGICSIHCNPSVDTVPTMYSIWILSTIDCLRHFNTCSAVTRRAEHTNSHHYELFVRYTDHANHGTINSFASTLYPGFALLLYASLPE